MEKRETFAQGLCEVLVKQKVVSESEGRALARAFKNSEKENFDDFLLDEGLVEENVLLRALAQYFQVPSVDVTGYFFDTQLLRNFPKDFLLRNRIIPLEMEDDIMIVVASNPDDPDLLPAIGGYTSEDIQFRVGLGRDISDAVKEFYDKSLTDRMDDTDSDLIEEQLGQEHRYHDLLQEEDEDIGATTPEQLDIDEE